MLATFFILTAVLLLLGVPLFVVFLLPSLVVLALFLHLPLSAAVQSAYDSLDKFPLLAVPFFILSGNIMGGGGLSKRLINWIISIVGPVRGGLGITVAAACTFFGAISGSSPATVASLGPIVVPHLLEGGYSKRTALGLITSCGAIAIIIPPSIAMVLYGATANVSIGGLFTGGILPGLAIAAMVSGYIIYVARKQRIPLAADGFSWRNVGRATGEAIWAIGMPLIILGGIYSGFCTPTEAAAVSVVYAILVSRFVYKELDMKKFWVQVWESAALTGQVLIILASAGVYAWVLTVAQVPQAMVHLVEQFSLPAWVVLVVINIILLIAGMLVDPPSAIVVFTPLFLPLARAIGLDPIHLGIIITVNLAIGMFTPPFGLNLFVSQAIFKEKSTEVIKSVVPFIAIFLLALALITYIPSLSLWLPHVLGN